MSQNSKAKILVSQKALSLLVPLAPGVFTCIIIGCAIGLVETKVCPASEKEKGSKTEAAVAGDPELRTVY